MGVEARAVKSAEALCTRSVPTGLACEVDGRRMYRPPVAPAVTACRQAPISQSCHGIALVPESPLRERSAAVLDSCGRQRSGAHESVAQCRVFMKAIRVMSRGPGRLGSRSCTRRWDA